MKSGKNAGVIILVASLLLAITFTDTWMVFRQTRQQTKDSGIYQLETISGELENTINDTKNLTMELAIASREYIHDKDALETFIYRKKAPQGLFFLHFFIPQMLFLRSQLPVHRTVPAHNERTHMNNFLFHLS